MLYKKEYYTNTCLVRKKGYIEVTKKENKYNHWFIET